MKLNIFVTLWLLAVFKDAAKALAIAKSNEAVTSESGSMPSCSQESSTEECRIEEGEKRFRMECKATVAWILKIIKFIADAKS